MTSQYLCNWLGNAESEIEANARDSAMVEERKLATEILKGNNSVSFALDLILDKL